MQLSPVNITCLTVKEQQDIVDIQTRQKITQTDLAVMFGVSRRTVQRVLENAGVLHYNYTPTYETTTKPAPQTSPVTQMRLPLNSADRKQRIQNDAAMLQILHEHQMTPSKLRYALAPSKHVVEVTLTQLPDGAMKSRSRVMDLTPDITDQEAANG